MRKYTMIISGIVAATTAERLEGVFGIDRLVDVWTQGDPMLAMISYTVPLLFGGLVLAVLKSIFRPKENGVAMALLMGLGFGLIHLLFLPDQYRETQIYLNILLLPLAALAYYGFCILLVRETRSSFGSSGEK